MLFILKLLIFLKLNSSLEVRLLLSVLLYSMKTLDAFKQLALESAVSANSENFFNHISNFSPKSIRWSAIYHKKSGDTPVHLAAHSGCVKIIKYFYENGHEALLEQRNFDGKTPLHVAAQSGKLECVQYLLLCNVSVDALKRADWTPLMLACTKNNLNVIQELLSSGANPRCRNKDGWTAFHIAVRESHMNVVCYLLDIDPLLWNTVSKNGRTPLHTAALHGHLDAVKILCNAGCDKDVQDFCSTTPLMDAASGNHPHVLKYLIQEAEVDIEKRDALGRSVLHLAAQSGSLQCVSLLVSDVLVDVNQTTTDSLTSLHFAAKEGQVECLQLLLQLGADASAKDNRGRSAEDFGCKETIANFHGSQEKL